VHDALVAFTAPGRDRQVREGCHLLAAGVVADRPQDRVVGPDALPGALLQAEQDFRDDHEVHAGEADLPGSRHRRLGQPPGGLIGLLPGLTQPAQWSAPRFSDRNPAVISRCFLAIQILVQDLLRSPVAESRVETRPIIAELDPPCNIVPCLFPRNIDLAVHELNLQ
jgi:hypothetical protein